MKKKSIWIAILVVVLVMAAIVGTIFYGRDSNGTPLQASPNPEYVMMTPDWNATVGLKANNGATYRVMNSDKKVIQGTHKTNKGNANILPTKTGDKRGVVKSDNRSERRTTTVTGKTNIKR